MKNDKKKKINLNLTPRDVRVLKFLSWVVVMVLLNIAGASVFLRLDLTKNRQYSLSKTSRELVSHLEEPFTVRVFLSDNLPSSYQKIYQDLRDVLEIYSLYGNKFFNYSIYTIQMNGTSDENEQLKKMARAYGIEPVQIQDIKQSQQTVVEVYMGMAFVHGDLADAVPVININENYELLLTRYMQRLTERSSLLLSMEEPVNVELVLSSSLYKNGGPLPESYMKDMEAMTERISKRNYGRFRYVYTDPDSTTPPPGLTPLNFNGRNVYASIVISRGGNSSVIDLLQRGKRGYEILPADMLEPAVEQSGYKNAGLITGIGYVADHGTPPLYSYNIPGYQMPPGLTQFSQALWEQYNLTEVYLSEETIPDGLATLIIAGPETEFSDWDLYQIDQFLMKGNSLAIFYDPMAEQSMEQFGMGQQSFFSPRSTGLEKLLDYYGLSVESAYVMDSNCFKQFAQDQQGSFQEINYYFAPIIESANVNKSIKMMDPLKSMIMFQIAPLKINESLDPDRLTLLFSSSKKSWLQSDMAILDPTMIALPAENEMSQYPLAAVLKGPFTSYFSGKEIPKRPEPAQPEGAEDIAGEETDPNALIIEGLETEAEPFVASTEKGKIFLIGSSSLLYNEVFAYQQQSHQSLFVLGMIDYLNGREDFAVMRNKGQNYSPLGNIPVFVRLLIQALTVVFIPLLAVVAGLIVLFRRSAWKRKIQNEYKELKENKNA